MADHTHRVGDGGPSMLVLSRGGHPGLDDALGRMCRDGTLSAARHETIVPDPTVGGIFDRIASQVRDHHIGLIVLHHYHSPQLPDPARFMEDVRALPHRPVVAFTGGDAFYNGFFRPSHPPVFRSASRAADVVFNTSMGAAADAIDRYGADRVALLPLGACQVRFSPPSQPHRPHASDFDVCFIGSNNRSRHPGRSYFWFARARERLVKDLSRRFGDRFAVFGRGWDGVASARGPIPFEQQIEVCRRARVLVGGVPFSRARYYMSNRPFNHIATAVPFVDVAVEGVDRILRDGEHWHLVDSVGRVGDRVDELLSRPAAERVEMGAAAAAYVASEHTQEQRWRSAVRTLTTLRDALLKGSPPPDPDLGFFLPEVSVADEVPLATRGWDGATTSPGGHGQRRWRRTSRSRR